MAEEIFILDSSECYPSVSPFEMMGSFQLLAEFKGSWGTWKIKPKEPILANSETCRRFQENLAISVVMLTAGEM